MKKLEIYILNVGQADTPIISTPHNNIIIIDAVKPKKLLKTLSKILPNGFKDISLLIITHPHDDHYSAVSSLINNYKVKKVVLAPFWYEQGKPGYHLIVNKIQHQRIPIRFLSGYERIYPDIKTFPQFDDTVCIELLGPSNNMQQLLSNSGKLSPNHLSIMTRLTYRKFSMIFAGDAQMENWAYFDSEGMLKSCNVLKSAHHGSKNGTQWERLKILSPDDIIVSSGPGGKDKLPDIIGSVIFSEYVLKKQKRVALTNDCGTIKIEVEKPESGAYHSFKFSDDPYNVVDFGKRTKLTDRNSTDWDDIVENKF